MRRQPRAEVMQGRRGGGGDAQWAAAAIRRWCSDIRGAWPVWGQQLELEAVLGVSAVLLPVPDLLHPKAMVHQRAGERVAQG